MNSLLSITLALAFSLSGLTAKDLVVDPNGSSPYKTLSSALAAEKAGDRILIAGDLAIGAQTVDIKHSVTIESMGSTIRTITLGNLSMGYFSGTVIRSLDQGLPLTFRNLTFRIVHNTNQGRHLPFGISGNLNSGEVRFDQVDVVVSTLWTDAKWYPIDLGSGLARLWMRRCSITCVDRGSLWGCEPVTSTSKRQSFGRGVRRKGRCSEHLPTSSRRDSESTLSSRESTRDPGNLMHRVTFQSPPMRTTVGIADSS